MSRWIHNDVLRGVDMVLQLKQAALEGGLDNPVSDITGCGVAVVTRFLDALIKDWIDLTSNYADAKRYYELEKAETKEWNAIGFDRCPSEYSEERQTELRALAERWNDEDEAEIDNDEQEEIEQRRKQRMIRKGKKKLREQED